MKRSDLKVGDELYYARPGEWTDLRLGDKVTVVAVEPYQEIRSTWGMRRSEPYKQVPSGNGVLVEGPSWGGDLAKIVVQLGHLRGPYAETAAKVEALRAEADAATKAAREARAAHSRALGALERRAEAAGYLVSADRDGNYMLVKPDVLAALLDAAGVPQSPADLARRVANT